MKIIIDRHIDHKSNSLSYFSFERLHLIKHGGNTVHNITKRGGGGEG